MKPSLEVRDLGSHVFFLALAGAALLLSAVPAEAFAALVYQRRAILRGEVWRLLTGHLVHAGLAHLALNLAGLVLAWVAFGPRLRGREWLAVSVVSGLGADLGVLLFDRQVSAMAGLSGLLHGLMAAGAVVAIRSGERLGWLVLSVLAAKVGWEQLGGALPPTSAVLEMAVAVGAHLYGSLAGALAGAMVPRPRGPV
jgi:rhomboid family GlyGly-CTERM serine protease